MAAPSTKQKLLSLIEDVEIVTRELFDMWSAPKGQKSDGYDVGQLVQLLVQKDKEIQEAMKTAREQGDLQVKLETLKGEVETRDQDIKQLQKGLKEAESILATAIYQAKEKLGSINKANSKTVSSEELIKYAHMISSTNAVAAPSKWQPGDVRRPYPIELDMHRSELARCGTTSFPHPQSGMAQSGLGDAISNARGAGLSQSDHAMHATSGMAWQQGMDMGGLSGSGQGHHQGQLHGQGQGHSGMSHKDHEDVEIMSSDSSSSSSSDE